MLQFYFLSVLLNLLAGLVLFYGAKSENSEEVEESASKKDEDLSFLDDDYQPENKSSKSKTGILEKIFGKDSFTRDKLFQLVLGILSVFVAIIKLLSAVKGVPFFGDLFPAIAGLTGGAAILINYFIDNSTAEINLPSWLHTVLIDWQKYIGIACMVIAVIHFILPGVLFL